MQIKRRSWNPANDSRAIVEAACLDMTPREEIVFRARFEIGKAFETLATLGVKLNISGERVRHIERKAYRKAKIFALGAFN